MKRIIFIAALFIVAATGARAQENDNLKIIDFDYRRMFDIDAFWYDVDQDGKADDGEIFVPGEGKITAYIDHKYFGKAGNDTEYRWNVGCIYTDSYPLYDYQTGHILLPKSDMRLKDGVNAIAVQVQF